MSSTIKAIQVQSKGVATVADVSSPRLRDDYILVKTHSIALNPTDWKHVDFLGTPGVRCGCDYSGTVIAVGSSVTKDLKIGDRVWGIVHGANSVNHEDGSFAEIVAAKGDVQSKIPDNLSFEEAATLGVGVFTCGQGLYQSLQLPLPSAPAKEPFFVLIYGGSSATGSLAIQYAKLSGLTVVTTASPHNFEYVKKLGADFVFDYNSPTCVADIRACSKNSIKHVFDCISEGSSITISAQSFSPSGGVYSALLTVDAKKFAEINPNIVVKNTLAYTVVGESFEFFGGAKVPALPQDFEFAKEFAVLTNKLLAEGKLKVHAPAINETGSGLEGALKGLQLMREGKVSGKKLVYTLQ
ncbi:hypothetical protein HDU83_000654 [Entophlyctis luteolus]|nr:hypothetical protein HDU83_000654 [Entophlyctis luteolus]KAJ3394698.1 hypothetical protein HDU84_006841 [Entophlyctis sp. JEL0112]